MSQGSVHDLNEEDENLARELAQNLPKQNKGREDGRADTVASSTRSQDLASQTPADSKARWAAFNFGIIILAATVLLSSRDFSPPEIRLLKAKQLTHLPQFQGQYRDEMLWGTYRPGLYLGLRTREAKGLQAGFMWFDPNKPQALQNIRHQAEDRDGLQKFGWVRHDGKNFGRQEIIDGHLQLTTSFAKRFCQNCRGGDLGVRVNIESLNKQQENTEEEQQGSVIFYIADPEGQIDIHEKGSGSLASGTTYPFGGWRLDALASNGQSLPSLNLLGLNTPHVHNLTDAVRAEIQRPPLPGQSRSFSGSSGKKPRLPDLIYPEANVAIFQYTGPVPMSIDFVFMGSLTRQTGVQSFGSRMAKILSTVLRFPYMTAPAWPQHEMATESTSQRSKSVSGEALTELLQEREQAFEARFEATFGTLETSKNPAGTEETAKAALSNMLGSIGYFYGSSELRLDGKIRESKARPLLASVPSRSFFPRGFLWDEGFHQLLLQKWDGKLSRDILAHWLDLLNSQGWMAREQILGEEARSRVPKDFIVQDRTAANPPTLFLAIREMAKGLEGKMKGGRLIAEVKEDQEAVEFLRTAFPRLKAWLEWFLNSQKGEAEGSWRWRGRKEEHLQNPYTGEWTKYTKELNPKTLTSGLDDYPRASHPSVEERHVDLYCWMALASSALASTGRLLKLKAHKWGPMLKISTELNDEALLNKLHYDESAGQYRDWGNHTEHVRLDRWYADLPEVYGGQKLPANIPRRQPMGLARFVDRPPHLQFVPQYGYVSLFPLATQILKQDSPNLSRQLQHLRSGGIMTEYGLRSLSTQASLHGERNTEHDPPYWRGPIWINLNYLVLSSIKHYAEGGSDQAPQARELYQEFRQNLLKLIVNGYQDWGYLWENYDAEKGTGRGCRPFTGWSALVVLIAAN